MTTNRVHVGRIAGEPPARMTEALDWIDWTSLVPTGARAFLKPNFTYPFHKPGVTTSRAFIEAAVGALAGRAGEVVICESDGGSCAWTADQAFEGHDLPRICAEHGARTMNLSRQAREWEAAVDGQVVRVELPAPLLHEADVFITLPVPKIHMMTGVSLGFKNQWGCLPNVKRLRRHHEFARVIVAINKILRPAIALFDGGHFLNRMGPMEGDAVEMNLLIASQGPGAGTLACCEIMQVPAASIAHMNLAMAEGLMPRAVAELSCNRPLAGFRDASFYLERNLRSWLGLAGFRYRIISWLGWDSPFANLAHQLLYMMYGRPTDFQPKFERGNHSATNRPSP
jgi:uncharacterized protein (DUF362 family)